MTDLSASPRPKAGCTISQAAAFVGVTVKTVRHYHRLGLVEEPGRDSSGYRRYGSADLLRLVQVRTLAAAGVPLAEIGELLAADSEEFTAAMDDVHRRLTERIDELLARRDTLHQLAHGDRVLLPERACAVLDRLTGLGFSPDYVDTQREALVLARAVAPEVFDTFLSHLEHRLGSPEFVDLTKRSWEARTWDRDDPRIEDLAAEVADNLLADRSSLTMPPASRKRSDATSRYAVVNRHREDQSPAIARLNALVEARLRAAGIEVPGR
ncbi:MerR family transcriptional regulator [Streptomyces sp. N35]|uniref:MerR family transcriptional regulator n=1 Tax=Streptomyces sp. N35 TaxID=2795730 RepID=UPI0018F5154A|nr:MerR family transcriptional regulator [Streptomyces sp. N35]